MKFRKSILLREKLFYVVLIFSFFLCSKNILAAPIQAVIFSETLAQVGGKVLTTRDVQISSILDFWFLTNNQSEGIGKVPKKLDKKEWWLDGKNKSDRFKNQLSILIIENLVVAEAENFSLAKVVPGDISRYASQISSDFGAFQEWKNLEISQTELESLVARYLRSKEFLKFKSDSMGFQITDTEAKDYFEKNKLRFSNLPFENFRESIKEFMARKDVEARMKEWIEILRKKYRARILSPE